MYFQKSLGVRPNDVVTSDLEGIRAEKDANISKRKKVDAELKQLNLNIQKLVSKQETRLAPVPKTIFHQCVKSYTCSQSNSDGSVLFKTEPSELDWLQVTH